MTKTIITGHGNFATGLISSLNLIVGSIDNMVAVDFEKHLSSEDLKNLIRSQIEEQDNDILLLTDLAGGTPFNTSVKLKNELKDHNIEVIAGTNLPMIIECELNNGLYDLEKLSEIGIATGIDSIKKYKEKIRTELELNEGI